MDTNFRTEQVATTIDQILAKVESKPDLLEWAMRKQIYLHESMITQKLIFGLKNGTKKWIVCDDVRVAFHTKTPFVQESNMLYLWPKVKSDPLLSQ